MSATVERSWKTRLWTWGVLVVALASYAFATYRQHLDTVDDAFISFRFAQHLADGNGLVWNIGGPPTEGYTNFLWVVILAVLHSAGVNLEIAAPLIMAAATVSTVLALLWIVKGQFGSVPPLAAAVVALYLSDPFTAIHTTSGLETPLAVFLVTVAVGAVLQLLRRPSDGAAVIAALAFVLAVLVRPDMALLVGVLGLVLLAAWAAVGARRIAIVGITAGPLLALYAVWKKWYFGYLLPNPFYVKSTSALALAGARPVARFFVHLQNRTLPLWIPLLLVMVVRRQDVAAVWADAKRRLGDPRSRATLLALAAPPLLGWLYYSTIVHEVGFASRFSFPTYPFVVLCGAAIATFLVAHPRLMPLAAQRAIVAVVIITVVARTDWTLAAEPAAFPSDLHEPFAEALARTGLGSKVSLHFMAAGLIPYRSGVNEVDPVGLVDNELCGRQPMTRESYEQILWSRPADVYLSPEPPASDGAVDAGDDSLLDTPYLTQLLQANDPTYSLTWRHPRFGPSTLAERRAFLHRRMRFLRDEWVWLGERYSEPLWTRLHFRLFVYVRKSSPFRDELVAALRPLADVPREAVHFQQLAPGPYKPPADRVRP